MVHQKVPKCTLKLNFLCQKSTEFLQKKFSSQQVNLGDHYLVNTFFLNSIFEPIYFLKLRQNFDKLTFLVGFFKNFPLLVC